MKKNDGAKAFFDDGLWFWLGEKSEDGKLKPKHVKFLVNTGTQEKETCDVRLTSILTLEELGEEPAARKKVREDKKRAQLFAKSPKDSKAKIELAIKAEAERAAVAKLPWEYRRSSIDEKTGKAKSS
jgi:hypothetical protein